jgi:glycosyltransferase involved in cell wall biosynthesis
MKELKSSVIIPAFNEEKNIEKCLNSLLNQSEKPLEIIVIDDGSTDKTIEIIKNISKNNPLVRLLKGEHKGPGFSRNLGANKSKGEILVFVDADMTFDKNYLRELIKPIKNEKILGTEDGKQKASNPNNIWSRCWGTYFKEYINPTKGEIFRAIRKKDFLKFNGFDPSLGYADDLTFFLKYNVTSQRVPGAICYHKNPETLKEVYKQSRWIGASLPATKIKSKLLQYLAPIIMLILSPIAIPLLTIKKCYKNKDFSTLLPWMPLFIAARYFGTLVGLVNAVYRDKNTR